MPRRMSLFFLILLLFLFLLENGYLENKNKEFSYIQEEIMKEREEALLEKENKLTEEYQFDDYLNYHIEYSKVLFKDIYRFKDEITIYKGRKNGIQKNNLVVNKNGLIGIVTTVYQNKSIVQLLSNEKTSLSVKIKDSYGILKYKDKELIVEGIDNKAKIEIGDMVTTSDLSIYPEHIKIGTVRNIRYDSYEIEQILSITPAVEFQDITYLGVITDLRGEK